LKKGSDKISNKILLVDDERDIVDLIAEVLQFQGVLIPLIGRLYTFLLFILVYQFPIKIPIQ